MITAALWFFGGLLILCAFALALTFARVGYSVIALKKYYKLKPTYKDWFVAGGFALGVVFALALLNKAIAADYQAEWLEFTEVYFGLDVQRESPVCNPASIDDILSSNLGITQQIVGTKLPVGRLDTVIQYTHHSCAIGSDTNVYDGFGVMFVYRVDW